VSRSLVPLSSAILHWEERTNKVFVGKRSTQLFDHFLNLFITTHLPLRRECVDHRHLLLSRLSSIFSTYSTVVNEGLSMIICIDMSLVDLLQYLICIVWIYLYSTYDSTNVWICKSLVMFMSYFWIKIKLKVILLSIIQKPYLRHFSFMSGFICAQRTAPFTAWTSRDGKWRPCCGLQPWMTYGYLRGSSLLSRRTMVTLTKSL
jgi:hypothetical protein